LTHDDVLLTHEAIICGAGSNKKNLETKLNVSGTMSGEDVSGTIKASFVREYSK
jgi:hypothetical protein